ncbi:MAG: tRNA (adenosine(37)-N6)-dimethylallyltransferase MiaA [Paramuribaculum sp.]|nr:tRNA (adenosine(37)-N6)-dimethylallyltransferase MiaA [Paramuribaculum sp.]
MTEEFNKKIIAITGPTASGKTRRAVSVANRMGGEIISADSRQIYRGMDIGTGKDLTEYGDVPYHLIDIADAGYKYNLYEYVRDARKAIEDVKAKGKLPIICGGTGLYMETLLNSTVLPEVKVNPQLRSQLEDKSLDELKEILEGMKRLHNNTDVDTKKRAIRAIEIQTYYNEHPEAQGGKRGTPPNALIIGVEIDREERRKKISTRLRIRLDEGLVKEVSDLMANGVKADDLIYYGLEYKFVTLYLTGELSYQEMVSGLETAIHQFAKRQMTWLRGMERRGFTIHWLPYDMSDDEFNLRVEELYND